MSSLENSEIVENLLNVLIDISGRKTDRGHAIFTLESVIRKLEDKYGFLTNIEVNDTRYLEFVNPIDVTSDINNTSSADIGEALHDIITTMDSSLGSDAGHFFIKEIRNKLSDEYRFSMDEMGVDLSLMQLEREVRNLERSIMKKKE